MASFALNLRWTGEGSTWAFFSLPTRAWEFAAGGLLASIALRSTSRRLSLLTGFLGLSMVAWATVMFSDAVAYPGVDAAVPVIGTALVILSGEIATSDGPGVFIRVLSSRPMAWVGRLSYSWYLWHWPFIVLAVLALNNDGAPVRTVAAVASLGAAYLAFRLFENPIRFSPSLIQSSRRTFVVGLVITLIVLAAARGVWIVASRSTPLSYAKSQAVASKGFFARCTPLATSGGIHYCGGGDLRGSTVIALVGDSHAGTWFNIMSAVAREQGVRLAMYAEPGCPFIPVVVRRLPNGPIDTSECLMLRKQGMQFLAQLKPRAVVLAQHEGQYLGLIENQAGEVPSIPEQVQLWKSAFEAFLNQMMAEGIRPAVILDDPTLPYEPAECVSETGSIAACEPTRRAALSTAMPLVNAEQAVLAKRKNSVPVFAPDSVLCNRTGCPLEIDNQLLYADTNHLWFGATRIMEPQISELLENVLAK